MVVAMGMFVTMAMMVAHSLVRRDASMGGRLMEMPVAHACRILLVIALYDPAYASKNEAAAADGLPG